MNKELATFKSFLESLGLDTRTQNTVMAGATAILESELDSVFGGDESDTDELAWRLVEEPNMPMDAAKKIIAELFKRGAVKLLDSLSRHPDVNRLVRIEIQNGLNSANATVQ